MIVLEILIAYYEYIIGVNTLLSWVGNDSVYDVTSTYLYNRRSFGLSSNSSVLAGKAILLMLLFEAYFRKDFARYASAIYLLVAGAALVTFSRSRCTASGV